MGKRRYRILILTIVVLFAGSLMAQQFDFESDKKLTLGYSQKLVEAIDDNDITRLKKLFKKNPSLVNSYTSINNAHGYLSSSGGGIPLLYDVVDRSLKNQCSIEMVETVLDFKPFMYCIYNDYTPFYLILNFIATHTIEDCEIAHKLFYAFINQNDFDVNQKPKDSPLPFSYLLSKNYEYLHETFDNGYISSDIIEAFINNGSSVNTRDVYSHSILIYAVLLEDSELIDFCINNNADVSIKNYEGKDALFFAIQSNNLENVSAILEANYPLSEDNFVKMNVCTFLHSSDKEIQKVIFDGIKVGEKDLENMINISKLFPERKLYFIADAFTRSKYQISTEELPSFIALFNDVSIENNVVATKNIESLIDEYKSYVIQNANKTGDLLALIELKQEYGLSPKNYMQIDEKEYLFKVNDIQLYKKVFPDNISAFTGRCKLNEYYIGSLRNSYANGLGTALTEEGLFSGMFVDGQGNGKMKIVFKNGYTYSGDVKNGLADGQGSDNNNYKGSWHKGQRHGHGVLTNWKSICYLCPFSEYHDDVYYENGVLLRNLSDEARERAAERRSDEYRQAEEETVTARENYEEGEWKEMSVTMLEAMFDVKSSGKMKKVWIKCPSSNYKRETEIYYSYSQKEYYVTATWLSDAYFDSYNEALEYALDKLDCH